MTRLQLFNTCINVLFMKKKMDLSLMILIYTHYCRDSVHMNNLPYPAMDNIPVQTQVCSSPAGPSHGASPQGKQPEIFIFDSLVTNCYFLLLICFNQR